MRPVVERFGTRMRDVPLLAPDSVVATAIRDAYGALVTPALLEAWLATPAAAPGREASSPWPERIEITAVESDGAGGCRVRGETVYLSSVELAGGGEADRRPVTLTVVDSAGWRIAGYEATTAPAAPRDRR